MWHVSLCLFLIAGCLLKSIHGVYQEGSVFLNSGGAKYVADVMDKKAVAYGYYNDSLMTTGWGVLEVKSGYGPLAKNSEIMYAAGYLEGVFTAEDMWSHYGNMRAFFFAQPSTKAEERVRAFFNQQDKWSRIMIQKHQDDPFWRHVSYIISHLDGLFDGYRSVAKHQKGWEQDFFLVQMLNGVGDLLDLIKALDPASRTNYHYHNLTPKQLLNLIKLEGHCSALVKTLPAFENIFMSHSSWFIYSATNRIYKHYHFNVKDDHTTATDMSFSSYPGFLESLDDFYLLSSGLVMLQTTNNVFNTSLYSAVSPQTLMAWQRVRLANMMAQGGRDWARILSRYNSGTYNNQYMVIDLSKITIDESIEDDALWVVEQIPTLVEAGDQTNILRAGYWPSYNVPFYEKVYNLSGYPEFVAEHGSDFSYQLAPRAKIFRRDQASVKDMATMKHIMRFNDYKNDPYSDGNACSTICCRGDLNSDNPRPDGCYDTKVTDFKMARKFQAYVINGPTLGDSLPPFSWTGPFANSTHKGLPESYQFGWVLMEPKL